ncbi:MAG: GNAT family N-acetyltransferase [Thermodesulfobacteriota bacterium]
MSKIRIKPCALKDLAPCAKLLVSVYSEPPYNEKWKLATAKAYLGRFLKADPEGCFVADTDGKVIGAIFSLAYPWQAGKSVGIQELFVSPKQRRKGIGKQLLSKINHGQKPVPG